MGPADGDAPFPIGDESPDEIDDGDILPSFGPRLTLDGPAPSAANPNIVNFADLGFGDEDSNVSFAHILQFFHVLMST